MYLKKSVLTAFGIEASVWAISKLEVFDGKVNANLSLYASESAYKEGKALLDNCRILGIKIDTTKPLEPQVFAALTRSTLNAEGQQENVFNTSHSGVISFQDAQIIK